MSALAELKDYVSSEMMSKQGRKLNQFFINLSNRHNQLRQSQLRVENQTGSVRVEQPFLGKKKANNQPFRLALGRDHFERLESIRRSTRTSCGSVLKAQSPKVKLLRVYDLEKKSRFSDRGTLKTADSAPVSTICKAFKLGTRTTGLFWDNPLGFVDLNRQKTNRMDLGKTDTNAPFVDPVPSFRMTRADRSKVFVDFFKTLPRNLTSANCSLQRNNYDLNVNRVCVEPKTTKSVPDFSKDSLRRSKSLRQTCFNDNFYDVHRPQKHVPSVKFGLLVPRKSLF